MTRAHSILWPAALALTALALLPGMRISPLADSKCDPDNGGLVLPEGLRASGVAVAPDESLYISADQNGKISSFGPLALASRGLRVTA